MDFIGIYLPVALSFENFLLLMIKLLGRSLWIQWLNLVRREVKKKIKYKAINRCK